MSLKQNLVQFAANPTGAAFSYRTMPLIPDSFFTSAGESNLPKHRVQSTAKPTTTQRSSLTVHAFILISRKEAGYLKNLLVTPIIPHRKPLPHQPTMGPFLCLTTIWI